MVWLGEACRHCTRVSGINQDANQGALSGYRIVDLTGVVLGPYATQILGDYGADVIKVEPPNGDIMRHAGPMRNPGMGHIFINANRNKRSIVLDLKKPRDHAALLKLCETADVLTFNIRPGSMARLGLSYEDLQKINPRLIYCGAYGYSEGGPYSDFPAYDDLIQGAACIPWLMTQSGSTEPRYVPATFADRVTALNMVHAVMAAIIARDKKGGTGLGQSVEVPMFECLLQFVLGEHLGGETWQPPVTASLGQEMGNMGHSRMLSPNRKPYKTSDGYVCALMYNDVHWRVFLNLIGEGERFTQDARFSTQSARITHIDALYAFVQTKLLLQTSAHWLKVLVASDIPVMPMMKLPDLLTDPHLTATGAWVDVEHPHEGKLRQLRPPVRMSATPTSISRPAPRLGEHTAEILQEINMVL
jgi:crotonobetainyl-CoA:carnitine CoA-transferase CaiB-like acyl-CoA transferase